MRFGIQRGVHSDLWVGNLNRNDDRFLNAEDKTRAILNAVIALIRHNNKKNRTTELDGNDNRYILSVEIESLKENK